MLLVTMWFRRRHGAFNKVLTLVPGASEKIFQLLLGANVTASYVTGKGIRDRWDRIGKVPNGLSYFGSG